MASPRYWKGLHRKVDPLGFGCWQLAGDYKANGKPHGWGQMAEADAVALIHAALDQGVQFFDTAAAYGHGRSEVLLGKGVRTSANAQEAVVCSKVSLQTEEVGANTIAEPFKQRVEASLARLQRERIDVLLIHSPPDALDWKNFDTGVLDDLVQRGMVGTYGTSAVSLAGVQNVIDARFGTCVEWVLHLLERRPVTEVFPQLNAAGMNFIARSPLSRGLISERYRFADPVFREDEFRSTLSSEWVNWTVESIRKFHFDDEDIERTAIRYCLSFDEMSVVIPGVRKEAQLAALLAARMKGGLSQERIASLCYQAGDHFPGWK